MKRWGVLGLFGVCLIPFIQRPLFFDDSIVIVAARAAAETPFRPYDYRADLGAPDRPIWLPGEGPAQTHPAMSAWCLGLALRVAGERAPVLHLTLWTFALLALLAALRISRLVCPDDTLAVALLAFSPAFFLTSQTLYPHLFYLAFYLWTIASALEAVQSPKRRWVVGLGLSLSCAYLSLDHWPVLVLLISVLWGVRYPWRIRGWTPLLSAGLVFVLVAGGWSLWEWHAYGRSHFLGNVMARTGGAYPWRAVCLPMIFFSAGLPFAGVAWPTVWRRSRALSALLGLTLPAFWMALASSVGGFSAGEAFALALGLSTGIAWGVALVFQWIRHPEGPDRLLITWFLVEFLFLQRFMVYPSGHHLLMMALPAAFLASRMLQDLTRSPRAQRVVVAGLVFLSMALAHADQEEAAIGPRIAADLSGIPGPRYFWGNDFGGFPYHLKAAGWKAYDVQVPLKPGEVLLVPRNFNVQGLPPFLHDASLELLGIFPYRIASPLRTHSIGAAAGWYSASWGALPYSWSREPAETFYLYRRKPVKE